MHKIKKWNKWLFYVLVIFLLVTFAGCKSTDMETPADSSSIDISIEGTDAHQIQKFQPTNETGSTI